jgi:benzoyl-CoA reductase/2-hydroxyglutaryl-CoA dehydratase subunit BcrC/BadD/HgdB
MPQLCSTGKIGYFCSYVPKELVFACGKTPVRIMPTAVKASEAEAYLPRNFCSLIKVTLASFLEGESDLEAVIHADSCDGLRRLHDVWRYYVDLPSLHLLDLPRINADAGVMHFQHALKELTTALEEHSGAQLAAENLASSIESYNVQRYLLSQLEDRWVSGSVPASRYYELRHQALVLDPIAVNEILGNELATDAQDGLLAEPRSRILLVGSLLTPQELVEAIENSGAKVVGEDSCTVGREQPHPVDLSTDLDQMLQSLARAYLDKPPCPRMRDFRGRLQHLSELVRDRKVDGVVVFLYKFCDLFLSEYPVLRESLQAMGVPHLLLEDEGEASLSGQHRTRLEAFLELLR